MYSMIFFMYLMCIVFTALGMMIYGFSVVGMWLIVISLLAMFVPYYPVLFKKMNLPKFWKDNKERSNV